MEQVIGGDVVNPVAADILMHVGTPQMYDFDEHGSGRYRQGSGKNPHQHSIDFKGRVKEYRKLGMSDTDIAKLMGMSTGEFRAANSAASNEVYAWQKESAKRMKKQGYSTADIARELGISWSKANDIVSSESGQKRKTADLVADYLEKRIKQTNGLVDVGSNSELYLTDELGTNVSKEKLNEALKILEERGYSVSGGRLEQPTNPGKMTTFKVIGPPGTPKNALWNEEVHGIKDFAPMRDVEDGIRPALFQYPSSLDSKRVMVRYNEDTYKGYDGKNHTGGELDGTIEIRKGVPDLSLGPNHYAQVRIMVDGTHYLKGMAVYSDGSDMPDGVDVIFNTNKHRGTPKMDCFKKADVDKDNPFGTLIKANGQSYYIDPKTGKRKLSPINMKSTEGDWSEWNDKLSAQFLAKQQKPLIERQLNLTLAERKSELDDICRLENPAVKKKLLLSYAEDCDSAAVHLKAASLPRQKYQVILPVPELKDNEVYAPNYRNGEKVALVRYPHGGIFEIPILTVNNRSKAAQKKIPKDSLDAIGINSNVAGRLSGADFDGDTVMVIPTGGKVKISSRPPLSGLIGFEPKEVYARKPGDTYERMPSSRTQKEMGMVSNLITDMTIKGASFDEVTRAVRHSMVVIDAHKHDLNYKQSEIDNNIKQLKRDYMGHYNENGNFSTGASTLISRSKSEKSVPKRQGAPRINPDGTLSYKLSDNLYYQTGRKKPTKAQLDSAIKSGKSNGLWIITNKSVRSATKDEISKAFKGEYVSGLYYSKTKPDRFMTQEEMAKSYAAGNKKVKQRTQKSTQMAEASDAYSLVSEVRSPAELAYANYANAMKSYANTARKEYLATGNIQYSRTAAAKYKKEVDSLNSKLAQASKNSPKERMAVSVANIKIQAYVGDHPGIKEDKKEFKKLKQTEMERARVQVGAKRVPIDISDSEWEAIQAGAISETKMDKILKYADIDTLRERAMPRDKNQLSDAKIYRLRAMVDAGYTTSEIADALGISRSTVSDYSKYSRGVG